MMIRGLAFMTSLLVLPGCATLQQIRALDRVDFSIGSVSQIRLAGIELSGVMTSTDLGLSEAGSLAAALRNRDVPLALTVDVLAENPSDNYADARLIRMEWTLFIDDRETVSGTFADETQLPRGRATSVPIGVRLNLLEFFDGSARDLLDLALSLSGGGGDAPNVTLEALPVIDSPRGPIVYPTPITIVSREGRQ